MRLLLPGACGALISLLPLLTACESSNKAAPPSGTSQPTVAAPLGLRPPALRQQPTSKPDPGPVDAMTLEERTEGAVRVRVFAHVAQDAGMPKVSHALVVDPDGLKKVKAALQSNQKPKPADGCVPCGTGTNMLFETATGINLGAVEIGCGPPGQARFRLAASNKCGTLEGVDDAALQAIFDAVRNMPVKDAEPTALP